MEVINMEGIQELTPEQLQCVSGGNVAQNAAIAMQVCKDGVQSVSKDGFVCK